MIDIVNSVKHYQPVFWDVDNSRLLESNRSNILYANEQNEKAQQEANKLATVIGNLKVHESQAAEKRKLVDNLDSMINNTLQIYGDNLRYGIDNIMQMSRDLVTDEKIRGLVETNKQYEDWVASVKANKEIDADTKEFILNSKKNQYHFDVRAINQETGEEEIIDGWTPGMNDNIIGYKNWQAGMEPVKNINYADIALGVFKQIEPNSNDWEYRTYYDANGNKLQGANILNAAYWIDSSGKRKDVTPQMINKAIDTYIAANPEVMASLRQDYEKALYFKEKGEDKYNVSQGANASMDFKAFTNNIFSGFGEAFAYKTTESGYKPGIVTSSGDSNKSKNGVINYTNFNNTTGTVGTITKKIDLNSMNSDRIAQNVNIYANTDEIFRKNNITEVGTTAKEKYNILLRNKDNLNLLPEEFATLQNNLYLAMDNERNIEIYNEDVLSRATPEQREILSQFDRLNNGDYINNNKDEKFVRYYNNFFNNEDGEPASFKTITPFTKEFGSAILKQAKKNNINLANEGIFYDANTNTFTINHTPTSFKTFATLFNDTAAEKRGVFKRIDEFLNNLASVTEGNIYSKANDAAAYDLEQLYRFGRKYNKVRDNRDDISVKIGTREYNKPIEIEQLHDYSIAELEAAGVDNTVLNREKDDFRASLKLIDFTQYQIYAPQELLNALKGKATEGNVRTSLIDMGNDDEAKATLQNWISGAINAKEGDKNYDLTKSNSENLITTFVDIPNIGVGNTIEFTHDGKQYTIFLKTFNDDGTGGLNDAQRRYYNATKSRREVDKLELGANEEGTNLYTRTLDLGVNNTYKMGYTNGTYHFNGKAIEKTNLIKLVDYRNTLQADAKQLAKSANQEGYTDYINRLFSTNEKGEYNNAYFDQHKDIVDLLVAYTGKPENVVKRDMLNDLINYY